MFLFHCTERQIVTFMSKEGRVKVGFEVHVHFDAFRLQCQDAISGF